MANKKAMEVFKNVLPMKFGVELEIADLGVSISEFVAKLERKGLSVEHTATTHNTVGYWKVVYDGSVQGERPCEIVSPPLTNFDDLKIVCETLAETNAKVNKTCGLHVHHDATNFTTLDQFKRLFQLWSKHEETMFTMLPLSRHNNRFCQAIAPSRLRQVERCRDMNELREDICGQGEGHYTRERYYHINITSYIRQGTIEFRGHSGTTDFEKIEMWVKLTHRILEQAYTKKSIKPKTEKQLELERNDENARARSMYKDFGIGGTDIAYYIRKRRKAFKQA